MKIVVITKVCEKESHDCDAPVGQRIYKGGIDTYLQVIAAEITDLAHERKAIDISRSL